MKSSILLASLLITATPSIAAEYIVNPMVCIGTHVVKDPQNDLPDYSFKKLEITSLKTQKANGSIVSSTLIAEEYAKTKAEAAQLSSDDLSGWYAEGLRLKTVDGKQQVTNSYGPYQLTIMKSETKNGVRTDTLTGVEGDQESTYHYQLECTANVVKEPTILVDTTNKCRRMANQAAIADLQKNTATKDLTCTAKARADYAHEKINTFFVFARCNNHVGYSYTVETKPTASSCSVEKVEFKGTRNINQ